MLSDENISIIADEVSQLAEDDLSKSNYMFLKNTVKELEKQKSNLIKSLKLGTNSESFQKMIYQEFESIEKQVNEVEKEIRKEENIYQSISKEQIMFFLTNLRNGNIHDAKYRKMLIDVLINKIYLFDDKVKIVFTTQHDKVEFKIDFIEGMEMSSYLKHSSPVH